MSGTSMATVSIASARPPSTSVLSFVAVLVLAVLGAHGPASAAKPPVAPMQMLVVHSVDARCAAPCEDWIALEGTIDVGASARFARVLRTLGPHRPPILINSPGGSVNDAIAIGRLIRSRHLDTAVGRTRIASCPADRDLCRQLVRDGVRVGAPMEGTAFCASACPLILAGGTRRFVGPRAIVGVHEFTSFQTVTKVYRLFRVVKREVHGRKVEVSRTLLSEKPLSTTRISVPPSYAKASAYWADMGIDSDILRLVHLATQAQIYWLTPLNLRAVRLATDQADGEALVFRTVSASGQQPVGANDAAGSYENAKLTGQAGSDGPLLGKVFWSNDQHQGPHGQEQALVATVVLADDAGRLVARLQRAASGDLHLTVVIHPDSARSPLRTVAGLGSPATRDTTRAAPGDLGGHVSAGDPMDVVLPADAAGPIAMAEWLDIPLPTQDAPGEKVRLQIGQSGARALERWRALDHADREATPRS